MTKDELIEKLQAIEGNLRIAVYYEIGEDGGIASGKVEKVDNSADFPYLKADPPDDFKYDRVNRRYTNEPSGNYPCIVIS